MIDERNESSEQPLIPEIGTSPTSISSLLKISLFVKYVAFLCEAGGAIMKGKLVTENKPGDPS